MVKLTRKTSSIGLTLHLESLPTILQINKGKK